MPDAGAPPALFETADYAVRPLQAAQVPLLQALYDANPEYFVTVTGRPAGPAAAQAEFDDAPPPHLGYRERWLAGVFDRRDGTLQGVLQMLSDFIAPGVWHLGLLLVATRLHGHGAGAQVYAGFEAWAVRGGARWLRLGVVVGNTRAERFWQRQGFVALRTRDGVDVGDGCERTVRVMLKPLGQAALADYLHAVPRDRPDSLLP